ncbi:MAG: dockerin type I repeat-containing protein, partial [Firmicutes bacterium]|nr:dockerin type I repeat-containing protein [Bacillota bacterium]
MKINKAKRFFSLLLAMIMLFTGMGTVYTQALAGATLQVGDYILMGTYYDEPILWRCTAYYKITGCDNDGNPIVDAMEMSTEPKDGYLPLMLSDKILCIKAFDAAGDNTSGSHGRGDVSNKTGYYRRQEYGSNYWGDSNIRDWLNSDASAGNVVWSCGNPPDKDHVWGGYNAYDKEAGFLNGFTSGEKSTILTVTQKQLLDGYEYSSLINSDYHRYDSSISSVLQNYDTAYSEMTTDNVFLLDVKQVYDLINNSGSYYMAYFTSKAVENSEYKDASTINKGDYGCYYLRSPYTVDYSCGVRAINRQYSVEPNGAANCPWSGIRPAFFLNPETAIFKSGSGTETDPYVTSSILEANVYQSNDGDTAILDSNTNEMVQKLSIIAEVTANENFSNAYVGLTEAGEALSEDGKFYLGDMEAGQTMSLKWNVTLPVGENRSSKDYTFYAGLGSVSVISENITVTTTFTRTGNYGQIMPGQTNAQKREYMNSLTPEERELKAINNYKKSVSQYVKNIKTRLDEDAERTQQYLSTEESVKAYIKNNSVVSLPMNWTEAMQDSARSGVYQFIKEIKKDERIAGKISASSNETKISFETLNFVMQNLCDETKEYTSGQYRVRIHITGSFGAYTGSITLVDNTTNQENSYTGMITSSNTLKVLNAYIGYLSDLTMQQEALAVNELVTEFVKCTGLEDFAKGALSGWIKMKFSQISGNKYNDVLAVVDAFSKDKSIISNISSPDDVLLNLGDLKKYSETDVSYLSNVDMSGNRYLAEEAFKKLRSARTTFINETLRYVSSKNDLSYSDYMKLVAEKWLVNCPVDIVVYLDGNEVGSVIDGEIQCTDEDVLIETDGDGKVISLYKEGEIAVKATAVDYGMLNVTEEIYNESEFPIKRMNTFDIPLEPDKELDISENADVTDGNDTWHSEEILASENAGITISAQAEHGEVFGTGVYIAGDRVTLVANAEDGYRFSGWYKGEDFVSSDDIYEFVAKEPVELEARFKEIPNYIKGDVDRNGILTDNDTALLLKYINGTSEFGYMQSVLGDVDEDNSISLLDAVSVSKIADKTHVNFGTDRIIVKPGDEVTLDIDASGDYYIEPIGAPLAFYSDVINTWQSNSDKHLTGDKQTFSIGSWCDVENGYTFALTAHLAGAPSVNDTVLVVISDDENIEIPTDGYIQFGQNEITVSPGETAALDIDASGEYYIVAKNAGWWLQSDTINGINDFYGEAVLQFYTYNKLSESTQS